MGEAFGLKSCTATTEQPIGSSVMKRHLIRDWNTFAGLMALSLAACVPTNPLDAQDRLSPHVRASEPLSPADQLPTFQLPDGFEIQLVAAEPDIQKPMNLAFDARGRLWVSGSVEYPFAAEGRPGRDEIRVLEDRDGDGRFETVTTFADGLNIPIGIYPYRNGVVAWSIPNIWFLQDEDGDGRCDKREILYGPLGNPVDTHGMQNAFRRGFDGWLYICHGFRNDSTITGRDGSSITLNSGNTYRVRLDGSRVEQITWGQVNPFGSTFLPDGDLVTADCHSHPLSLLIRGGYYQSFGKPHDGLGFVPPILSHTHGSTAISGAAFCSGTNFPDEYRGSLFVGNVVTSRVHRDSIHYAGSTMTAREEADFLTCDDPWFRPVDLQTGPDGALYVADFYNRIIGHYEVPLDHPGRDRVRGRIWRVTYRGDDDGDERGGAGPATASVDELTASLGHPSLAHRMLVMDQLTDRIGREAIEPLRATIRVSSSPTQIAHGLWVLHRLGERDAATLREFFETPVTGLRVHIMRMLSESSDWTARHRSLAMRGLNDAEPLVRRAAADAVAQHPHPDHVRPLLDTLSRVPEDDRHLRHGIRIALKQHLRMDGTIAHLARLDLSDSDRAEIADVLPAVPSTAASAFLVEFLGSNASSGPTLQAQLRHAVAYASLETIDRLVELARRRAEGNVDLQLDLLASIQQQLERRGVKRTASIEEWGRGLADELLASIDEASAAWGNQSAENPWDFEPRHSADGRRDGVFLSSLPGGEQRRAVLRSRSFPLPERLSFFLCGHRGFPNQPASDANYVQLRLTDGGQIVHKVFPPRSDTAQRVEWDLTDVAGQDGYVEIVDGMNLTAFAWLGVSRFDPPVISVPKVSPRAVARRQSAAAGIARALRLESLVERLRPLVLSPHGHASVRAAAADAIAHVAGDRIASALAGVMRDHAVGPKLRHAIAVTVAGGAGPDLDALAEQTMKSVPTRVQQHLADSLSASRDGGELLLTLVERGAASARLLQQGGLREKLIATGLPDAERRVSELTESLPPVRDRMAALIRDRLTGFATAEPSRQRGRLLFRRHCEVCHRVQGRGQIVGPQLDGIGNRGLERIAEDLLDPNRNVDAAFHVSVIATDEGRVLTGLFRRKDGNSLILAGRDGKEISVPEDSIDEQTKSRISIMPDNFGDTLQPQECFDILAWLASLKKQPPTSVAWNRERIDSTFRSEGVAVADVNRDGTLDILTGELWYEAPDWERHEMAPVKDYGDGSRGYSESFLCFTEDVNRDEWPDLIVIGFPGAPCHWCENPRGEPGHWKRHRIWHSACNETPLYADLFGDGRRVLVMAWQPEGKDNAGRMAWFDRGSDPTKPWTMHPISRPSVAGQPVPGTHRFAHGLGVGDVNGDGRNDVICTGGWWEQPPDVTDEPWPFHAAALGPACANMIVTDVNGDGVPDVVSSSAHDYGLWWHEQRTSSDGASTEFVRHDLFPDLVSQTHSLNRIDIDGDRRLDLVTGKRWWAHGPSGDPGSDEAAALYWFQSVTNDGGRTTFIPRLVDNASGVGTQFVTQDINGDSLPDIVTANKNGVFVFRQRRATGGAR